MAGDRKPRAELASVANRGLLLNRWESLESTSPPLTLYVFFLIIRLPYHSTQSTNDLLYFFRATRIHNHPPLDDLVLRHHRPDYVASSSGQSERPHSHVRIDGLLPVPGYTFI